MIHKNIKDTTFAHDEELYKENQLKVYLFMLNKFSLYSAILHFLLIFLFISWEIKFLSIYNIFSSILWFVCYFQTRKRSYKFAQSFLCVEILVHGILATIYAGWDCGFHFYFIAILAFSSFNSYWKSMTRVTMNFIICIAYIFLNIYCNIKAPIYHINKTSLSVVAAANVVIAISILSSFAKNYKAYADESSVKLKEANETLKKMATTDPLTGLYNRRGIIDSFSDLASKENSLIVAICDIDNFKIFNEKYGHDCGDYVLQNTANTLVKTVDNKGLIGRWGGEEFLVIISQYDADDTYSSVENIRKTVHLVI